MSPKRDTLPAPVLARIRDLSAKVNLFNDSHGTLAKTTQSAWNSVAMATKALTDDAPKADLATIKQDLQTVVDQVTAFESQPLNKDDSASFAAIVESTNALSSELGISPGAKPAPLQAADAQFGNPGVNATTLGIQNFWNKVMEFSRTHGAMGIPDRKNLDSIVVAAATMMSEPSAGEDLNRTRVQIAVTAVDKFNAGHGTLQHPDLENWEGIVGAVNALATAAGAGTGTVKRG